MSSPLSSIMCTEEEEEVVVKHLQQQRKNSIDGGRRVEWIQCAGNSNVMIGSCVYKSNRWSYTVEMGVQIDIESVSNKAIKIDNKKWSKKQKKYRLWMSFDCLFSPADHFSIIYLHERGTMLAFMDFYWTVYIRIIHSTSYFYSLFIAYMTNTQRINRSDTL